MNYGVKLEIKTWCVKDLLENEIRNEKKDEFTIENTNTTN